MTERTQTLKEQMDMGEKLWRRYDLYPELFMTDPDLYNELSVENIWKVLILGKLIQSCMRRGLTNTRLLRDFIEAEIQIECAGKDLNSTTY